MITTHANTAVQIWETPLDLENEATWEGKDEYQSLWQLPSGSYARVDAFGIATLLDRAAARTFIAKNGSHCDLLVFTGEATDLDDARAIEAEQDAWHTEMRMLSSVA